MADRRFSEALGRHFRESLPLGLGWKRVMTMRKKVSGVRCQVSGISPKRLWHFLKAGSWQLKADNRGFTLLLAALVASITLALGASIFAIAKKEVTLSSVGRDSQYAFYAADTGAECALYWDARHQSFPTSTPSTVNIRCDNEAITTSVASLGNTVESTFQFEPTDYCAGVSVRKINDAVRVRSLRSSTLMDSRPAAIPLR